MFPTFYTFRKLAQTMSTNIIYINVTPIYNFLYYILKKEKKKNFVSLDNAIDIYIGHVLYFIMEHILYL